MSSPLRRPATAARRALLVLGVLAGLLAMHGLAPGTPLPAAAAGLGAHGVHGALHAAEHAERHAGLDDGGLQGAGLDDGGLQGAGLDDGGLQGAGLDDGGLHAHRHSDRDLHGGHATAGQEGDRACHSGADGGGHAQHADSDCTSAAVGGGPQLPEPPPATGPLALPAGPLAERPPADALSARAPPSLSELQLLRI